MADHGFADEKSTVLASSLAISPRPTAQFHVVVESGVDAGAQVTMSGAEPAETIIGQSPICALRLTDPTVSRRHVALDVVGDRLRVRDLDSKNGTYAGAICIKEAFVGAGDVLSLGSTVLRVSSAPAPTDTLPIADRFGGALGVSREMRRLFPLLARLAQATIPVLIEGETGTGKEAVAEALHARGPRASKAFVVFDCTAVAPSLVESELFGHEKGAFTGAVARRKGVFEQAHGGTLLIDELGDLPLDLQAKLLRVIETGQVRPVGAASFLTCDVRVVAATRRDMERLVTDGKFRDDLFHRLAVGRVALPPLRERRGDVPLLIEHFCGTLGVSVATIPREVRGAWAVDAWPGNVRQLRNAVTRQVVLGELANVQPSSAPSPGDAEGKTSSGSLSLEPIVSALLPYDDARERALALFESAYTERMLGAHNGNAQRAAESAGIAVRYFRLLRSRHRA